MLSRDKDSKERERNSTADSSPKLNYRLASVSRDALRVVPEAGLFLKWDKYSVQRNWREGGSVEVFHRLD